MHYTSSDARIDKILDRTTCDKHSAIIGEPCWVLEQDGTRKISRAVCGTRTLHAGFLAVIPKRRFQ